MKTACFFQYHGPGRISIARYEPDYITGLPRYSGLAPTSPMLDMDYDEYRDEFWRILQPLNPQVVWEELHILVTPMEPVLLCWEGLQKRGQWCHRTMVAKWFEATLDVEVPELSPRKVQLDLF